MAIWLSFRFKIGRYCRKLIRKVFIQFWKIFLSSFPSDAYYIFSRNIKKYRILSQGYIIEVSFIWKILLKNKNNGILALCNSFHQQNCFLEELSTVTPTLSFHPQEPWLSLSHMYFLLQISNLTHQLRVKCFIVLKINRFHFLLVYLETRQLYKL